MLNKRIDIGSIPFGLCEAGEDIVKGSAVVKKDRKIYLPTTQEEADNTFGFATLVIETDAGSDVSHDVIPAGKKVVVYTLVKNNRWGTTQFIDGEDGDKMVVDYTGDNKGKLRKITAAEVDAGRTALFEMAESYKAGSVPMIDVDVL